MHSLKTTHKLKLVFNSLKGHLGKSSLTRAGSGSSKRRLATLLFVVVLVLGSFLTLTGYYGMTANAAPKTAASFLSESYSKLYRGMNQLMSLLGVSKSSSNLFSTVSATPTISGCYYSGGQSRATVSVEVSWTGLANGDDITVSLPGALNGVTSHTITQQTGANPPVVTPQVVAFEVASGFSGTLTTSAPGASNDTDSIVFSATCAPLVCGPTDLGGTVFNDYDADGTKDVNETNGASGVTVTAFDKNGATYTTTTDGLGQYCLAVPVANYPVRVEFTNIPSEFFGGFTTRLGTGNGSTVQFASAPNQSINLGVNNPADYCQTNPKVLIPCFFFGDPLATTGNSNNDAAAEPSMVRFNYNDNGVVGQSGFTVEKIALASETGPIWGIAYKKATGHLFGATTIRRHAGLGPQGLGGIYVLNAKGPMGMGNVVDAWNVETQLGINVQNPGSPFGGSTNPVTSNVNRGLSADKFTPSRDAQAFSEVGKLGFGDIDISDDGNTLFFVNQYDKKLYGFDITNYDPTNSATRPTAANITVNTTIPDPGCVNGEWRPFGTKYRRGILYVGGVCNAITSNSLSDLRADVYAYNIAGNSWQQIFNFPLSYPKGSPNNGEKGWHPWTDDWNVLRNGSNGDIIYSVPMFTDIEFDIDGTMVLGFNDRSGMQTGRQNWRPDGSSTSLWNGFVGGDTLRAFFSNGTYVLENNAKAGPTTGFGANNNEGPGFGEFYEDNWRGQGHTETTVGGLAIRPGSGEVVTNSMDPHESSIWAAGVRFLSNSSGLRTHAVAVYSDSNTPGSTELGKSTGVGDVELRCEISNYMDLGNRAWMDANRNGIQDPGEMPISGATVHLYQQGNTTAVATAVTASDGTYHFTSVDADDNGSPDNDAVLTDSVGLVGGNGLLANTNYVIRFDRGADYQFGGVLYGKRLSTGNAGGGTYGTLADLRDSDATSGNTYSIPGGNYPEIVVQHLVNGTPTNGSGEYGEVDHTMDTGFYLDYDFGDAPDPTFPTLLASNGARHIIVDGLRLGANIDAEADGQPTAAHNGDDNNGTPDDEDGVVIPSLIAGQTATIQVTASATGRLNAWIDFNGDGDWNDAGEKVFNDTALVAGINNLTVNVPLAATQGNVCTRFRFTSTTGMATTPTGEAADGEVEDYLASIIKNISVGNQVFFDTNNNGTKDSGELGINGVTVELYNDADMNNVPDTAFPLDVKTTATASGNAGMYLFTQQTKDTATGATLASAADLLPGKYIVCLPASNFTGAGALVGLWSSGTTAGANGTTTETASPDPNTGGAVNNPGIDNDDNGSLSGGRVCSKFIDVGTNEPLTENPYNNNDSTVPDSLSNLTVDFGFYGLSIGNLVFNDNGAGANYNNATFDAGEAGIAGVTVKLYAENGTTLLMTKATDNNGKYLFPGLAAGKYFVEIDRTSAALTGFASSKDGANAGNPNAADSDDNGPLANVTATTVRSPQIMLVAGDSTTTGESDQAQSITPGFGNPVMTDNASTPDANSNLKVDFGFVQIYSLGNRIWKDLDRDGTINNGEVGVDGVTLRLLTSPGLTQALDINGVTVADQTTTGGGYYRFDNIPRGDYVVEVRASNFTSPGMLTGCVSSPADAGDPDTDVDDSDDNGVGITPNGTTGIRSAPVTVGEGNGAVEPTNDNDPATNPQPGEAPNGQSNRTVDFGFSPAYSLGNRVWKDLNNNGVIDGAEVGVNGVVLRLLTSPGLVQATDINGTLVADQTTANGGYYRFDNLPAGDYVVEVRTSNFTAPGMLTGCVSSTGGNDPDTDVDDSDDNGLGIQPDPTNGIRSAPVTLGPAVGSEPTGDNDPATNPQAGEAPDNQSNRTVDFGFVPVYSLGNRVWKDTDNSGTINGVETGVNGVVVRLLNAAGNQATDVNGTLVADQTTTGGGYYRFDNLLAGDYTVEVRASNFTVPGILTGCVSSTGGNDPDTDVDDSDDNGLGIQPDPSNGIRSAQVTLGPAVGSEPTGDNDPATNPQAGEAPDDQSNRTVDFGFVPVYSLGNRVWKDTDNSGTINGTEVGVNGVVIRLLTSPGLVQATDVNGSLVADQTTANGGYYRFDNLLTGDYVVEIRSSNFTVPGVLTGCVSSTGGNDPDTDVDDSDDNGLGIQPDPTNGIRSAPVTLGPGVGTEPTGDNDPATNPQAGEAPDNQSNRTVDFGFVPVYSLGNRVWKDTDNSGTINGAEVGINGVVVRLLTSPGLTQATDVNGNLVADQTTANGGYYRFDNLLTGDYVVEVRASNFTTPGILVGCISSGPDAGDPDSDVDDSDDNGVGTNPNATTGTRSAPVTLGPGVGTEPTGDNDPATNPVAGESPDNQSNRTVDFGFVHVYSLGNRVWKDMDNSGSINGADGASPGINGVVVRLLTSPGLIQARDVTGGLVPDQTTANGGYYRFDNILAGDYVIEIVSSNFTAPGVLVGCATSTGTNGIVGSTGPTEPATDPDVNATDSDDNGEQAGAVVRSKPVTVGDGNGAAEPTNDNDPSTNPQPGEAENNQSNRTVDFGFTPIMNLGNLVWKDYDNDGIRDTSNPTEPGVSGVKVVLYADTDNNGSFNPPTDVMLAMTTTASDGSYSFTTVLPGKYFVVIDASNFTGTGMLVGCLSSTGNDSGDTTDNNDNGIDNPTPPTGGISSVPITLIGGTEPTNDGDGSNGNLTIDFSFIPTNMVIGNLVWKDTNNNGVRDTGEMPVAGVKVNLYRDVDRNGTFNPPTDTLVATKTTGTDGTYRFTDLIPDPYFVQVDASNFNTGGPLYGCASSYSSVSGNSDQNDRDHGSDSTGPALNPPISTVVNLVAFNEPSNPVDGDDTSGNLTIDFGFATLVDVTIGGSDICIGPGDTLPVTTVIRNTGQTPQGDNATTEFTAVLPSQLVGIPSTCVVTGGTTTSCTVTATTVTWNGTIPAGQSVSIKYLAQVGNAVGIGTQFCITSIGNFDSDNNGSNETSYTRQDCSSVTCPPVGPGIVPPNGSGCSILIYPVYTSSPANPAGQNTRINLTNINPSKPAAVHMFFVDGASCSIADSYVCLTANQTTSFLASDMDPGITGYVVAVAVDDKGCPINFNFLVGDEYVKFESGHRGNLTADCVSALAGGLPPCDGSSVTAPLNFDGVSYSRLPQVVSLDNIPTRAEGNDTMLILNRLSGNLANGMDKLNPIFGILYDDVENALSFTFNPGTCQMRGSLNNGFPRTVPRFELAIPAGRSGWMKLYSTNAAVNGAAINQNPNLTSTSGAFVGAHSLHNLTQAPSSTMTMPVFPPSCL